MKISSWNINGYNSKNFGNKLCDSDFLDEIQNSEVVGLVETHVHNGVLDKLEIPGFKRLSYKNENLNKNSKKGYGGIAVFIKEHLKKIIIPLVTKQQSTVWVKIKKEGLQKDDIFLATVYMNPYKSNKDDAQKIHDLQEEILYFQKKGQVVLQGDINARTGNERDFIIPDKFEEDFVDNCTKTLLERNSEDKGNIDNRGREILETCKTLNLVINNGRKPGDMYGKYTSIQWNGSSVVDYVISSYELYQDISTLRIGTYIPWISDHCALHFTICCKNDVNLNTNTQKTLEPAPKQFFWGKDSREKFISALSESGNELNQLESLDIRETENILSLFTGTVTGIAHKAELKYKKAKTKSSPWYDNECIQTKNRLRYLSNMLKKHPYEVNLREKVFFQKKKYTKLVRSKKRKHREQVIKDMALNRKDGKTFWKLLDRLKENPKNDFFINRIQEQKWKNTFEGILRNENEPIYPPDCSDVGPLDYEITLEELTEGSYILRNGKTPGPDAISNEMLQCILESKSSILLKLFNSILIYNGKTTDWYTSILVLLHKKGKKTEPLNYRGISLLSCVSKFFTAILNKRLLNYVKEKKILSDEQLGFVSGNRTSDAHIIIHNIIQKYCHKKNKRIHSCFIDFSKAFDNISRDILFKKLKTYGITGNFYNVLKNMYCNDSIKIKLGEHLSEKIYPNQGVRQGCVLSPLLFNIYLADLPRRLELSTNTGPIIGNKILNNIIWADDLVILSETEEGLNNMLAELALYTEENALTINIDKSKAMIFNKTGKLLRRNFKYKNANIETVREYKYLGFIIVPSGSIVAGLNDLKSRGNRAIFQIKNRMGEYFRLKPEISIKLFNTLVKPILLYMADLWGCLKMPKNDPIDTVQVNFLKQLLGVQTQTTNIGVLLETGEIPLSNHAKKLCVKNWARIRRNKGNNLIQISLENSENEKLMWFEKIREELFSVGLGNLFMSAKCTTNHIEQTYFQRKSDIFHQAAFEKIRENKSKLRTYSLFKTEIGFEKYLTEITSVQERIALSKFRLSNHTLMIEKGRHLKLERNKRVCPFCPGKIEDELHFLIGCKNFKTHRATLLNHTNNVLVGFAHLNHEQKMIKLLTDPRIIRTTATYLNKTLELRQFLLKRHKNNL